MTILAVFLVAPIALTTFSIAPSSSLAPVPAAASPAPTSPPQVTGYGSTGAHGAFVVAANTTRVVDLATEGAYDAVNWVVRFDYTSVDIGANATVQFTNHPSRAPVAWIVQGNVTVGAGATVDLNGANGTTAQPGSVGYAEPGPGGFRGGRSSASGLNDESSAGFGPGGNLGSATNLVYTPGGASYRTSGNGAFVAQQYGGPAIFQLIGGSGGAAGRHTTTGASCGGGGAGGGALLIAADGTIQVLGLIRANGGYGQSSGMAVYGGGGSGGAIRLASLAGVQVGRSGALQVNGGTNWEWGGFGRCRIECPNALPTIQGAIPDQTSIGQPQLAFRVTPPRVRVASIGGIATPADSTITAGLGFAGESADMIFFQPGLVDVVVDCTDLPAAGQIYLRISRAKRHANVLGPFNVGAGTSSVTIPNVDLSAGFSALQARVAFF